MFKPISDYRNPACRPSLPPQLLHVFRRSFGPTCFQNKCNLKVERNPHDVFETPANFAFPGDITRAWQYVGLHSRHLMLLGDTSGWISLKKEA